MANAPLRDETVRKGEGGAALVETALVLPFVLLLTIGVIDFGRAFSELATAQEALRGAGRYLSRLSLSRVCGTATGQAEAKKLAFYGDPFAATGSTPVINNWDSDPTNITIALDFDCSAATPPSDGRITMNAKVVFVPIAWRSLGLPSSLTLQTSHVERWIGQ